MNSAKLDIPATISRNRLYIDSLLDQLLGRPESIVPFIGAGLSIPSGMPGWHKFLATLIEDGLSTGAFNKTEGNGLQKRLKDGNYEAVADLLWTYVGEVAFVDRLRHEFRAHNIDVGGAVRRVPMLAKNLVLTTNYDRIAEIAWDDYLRQIGSDERVEQLLPTNKDDFDRALTGVGRFVFKLHGDVERPETWILTERRYRELYDGPNAPASSFLGSLLSNRIPLFLGCSLQEERILSIMRSARRAGFGIMAYRSRKDQERTMARLKDVVKIIWLRPEDVPNDHNIFDVLDPLLAFIADRARLGRVIWPSEPQRDETWGAKIAEFESNGEYEKGFLWAIESWPSLKSWKLYVQMLHLSDLAGKPELGLSKYAELREDLDDSRSNAELQHAVKYYLGRLLGQQGLFKHALDEHAKNLSEEGLGDFYQLRSRFEIAQLQYRIEDFKKSWETLWFLWPMLEGVRGQDLLAGDVLRFLGTLEAIHVIHDLPFSPGLSMRWQAGKPEKCIEYAKAAYVHAEHADSQDRKAWALTVSAFGLEGLGRYPEAEEKYIESLQLVEAGPSRPSSMFHLLNYYAGFHRRRGDFDKTIELLDRTLGLLPAKGRLKERARVHEEHALVLSTRGERSLAKDHIVEALKLYAKEPAFQTWVDWPIVRRLRATCDDFRLNFDKFFGY